MNYSLKKIATTLTAILALVLNSCTKDESRQVLPGFSDYLETIGYSFYNPPRTDRGPGSVFRFVDLQSGRRGISPVCRNLFPDLPFFEAEITLPEQTHSDTFNIDFAVGILGNLIQTPLTANLEQIRNVEIKFGDDIVSHSYAEEDAINEHGEPRELSPTCFGRLKLMAENGKLGENVFFVQEAIQVHEVSYKARWREAREAGAEIPIKKVFVPKADVSFRTDSQDTISFSQPRYVAFKAMLIENFVDTGLTTAGTAVITATPMRDFEKEREN